MKKNITLFLLLVCTSLSAGTIYYGQMAGGSQWKGKPDDKVITAVVDLIAIPKLSEGDEVWLAAAPEPYNIGSLSGVRNAVIRGGFNGTETKKEDRNGKSVTTVYFSTLENVNLDWVTLANNKAAPVVSGDVTISNVTVSGSKDDNITPLTVYGATSPYKDNAGKVANGARVVNCWFYNNKSFSGALWVANCVVSSCSFVSNCSQISGGALNVNARSYVENCWFYNNYEGCVNNHQYARDIYAGNIYPIDRKNYNMVAKNLIQTLPTEYSNDNTEYMHSADYVDYNESKLTLKQNSASPFIDKGTVSLDLPSKTIWGVNRLCDRVDIGAAEFQKIMAYLSLDSVKVTKPDFISQGWNVKDTVFSIVNGLDRYYMPGEVVAFTFTDSKDFEVSCWHFRGDTIKKDLPWSIAEGDSVRYETTKAVYDTLHIGATQNISTFKLKVDLPHKDGVSLLEMKPSQYNTSLSADKRSASVYVGEDVTLKVKYDTLHYHFNGWFKENNVNPISNDTVFVYKVSSDAGFAQITEQTISASVYANSMDVEYKILPNETYGNVFTTPENLAGIVYGDSVSFSQTEALGKRFLYWVDSTSVGTDTIRTSSFKLGARMDHMVFAVFEDIKYTVDVVSDVEGKEEREPHEGIEFLSGDGTDFLYGSNTIVKLDPKDGYSFRGWRCSALSSDTIRDNPLKINSIKNDFHLTACFTQKRYKLEVSLSPEDWPVTITMDHADGVYFYGDTPRITVSDTIRMDRWEKYSNGKWVTYTKAAKQIIIPGIKANTMLRAVYNNNIVSVGVKSADEKMGKAEVAGKALKGQTATFTATPEAGYRFIGWTTPKGDTISKVTPFALTLSSDTLLTANFKARNYKVNVSSIIANNPKLDASKYVHITAPADSVVLGSKVTLSVKLEKGFYGVGWVEKSTPSDTLKVASIVIDKIDRNYDYTFVAKQREYTVTLNTEPSDWPVTLSQTNADGRYLYGDRVVINTTDTLRMASWIEVDGEGHRGYELAKSEIYIDAIDKNYDLYAVYSDSMKLVKFEVNEPDFGYVDYELENEEIYFWKGLNVTVTAHTYEPETYKFVKWTSNDETISNENPFTFKIEQDTTIVANIANRTSVVESEAGSISVWQPSNSVVKAVVSMPNVKQVVLYNSLGVTLYAGSVETEDEITVVLPEVQGVYILQFLSTEGERHSFKIIKK